MNENANKSSRRSRNGQFEGTAAPITSNRNHIPAMIDELDFSLLGEPNDMFDSNQPVESAQSLSPQYYPPSTAGPSTASPFFGTKSPNILGQQFRRQSFGGRMLVHCKCCPQSDISPGALPSQCPGASRQHQMPTPQELPLEQQNIGHQLTAAGEQYGSSCLACTDFHHLSASDMEQQEWPSDRADLIRVKSTDSHISASVPGRFTTNTHIDTPIESASSSSTKSPLLPVPSALPNSQPAPNHNPAPNSHPPTTQSNPNPELEARFERILDTVEEAGFDSIDSMGSCYYTTTFSPNSICASTQSMSRRRHLRKFLEDISESARGWNAQEAQGYHEGITRSAVNVYVEELGWLKDAGWGGGDGPAKRDEGVRKIRDAVLNEDMMGLLRDEKRFLRDRVSLANHLSVSLDNPLTNFPTSQIPESWSLLTELARSAGLSQPQSSQAACVFLCILMTG